MIAAENLVKRFGGLAAVDRLSLAARPGEVLGLLGPNGAGKTTTMRLLSGFLAPDSGRIEITGLDLAGRPLAARAQIGYLPEGAPVWAEMSAEAFLAFFARARALADPAPAIAAAARAAGLTGNGGPPVLRQTAGTLSKGYRRRLALAAALLHDPPVLILDEPTDGLDPNQKRVMRRLLARLARGGEGRPAKTILLSTHSLEEVEAVCTRVLIIGRGVCLANDTPAGLLAGSRYHNAVSATLAADRLDGLCAALAGAAPQLQTETRRSGALARLTVFPGAGFSAPQLARRVQALADQHTISLQALTIEAGRLDDCFRRLTAPRPAGEAD